MKTGIATTLLALGLLASSLAPPAAAETTPEPLADAVALAKDATRLQAAFLGLDLDAAPLSAHAHALPSEAALALVTRHDAPLDDGQAAQLRALDDLPEAQRAALARVIDAFLAMEDATVAGLTAEVPDHAPVLRARLGLLDAALALDRALDAPPPAISLCPITVNEVLALDLLGCSLTYYGDYVLSIDVGGNDVYLNNAGGSDDDGPGPEGCPTPFPVSISPLAVFAPQAAAAVDLGGDDQYVSGRSCGINGGGQFGSGFLLDAQGRDTYRAGGGGTNGGGAFGGVGFLLDALGDDDYGAGSFGTNGGAGNGAGMLIDVAGNDEYDAGGTGVNGASSLGAGFLLDLTGNDRYAAWGSIANGAASLGVALLLDGEGTDVYQDEGGGTGTDKSVVPKMGFGAQVDLTHGAAFLNPTVEPLPDGSCYVYNDSDGDGVRDYHEDFAGQLLGPLPCTVNPAIGPDQSGTCWVYNDMDGDGMRDGNELVVVDVPCPPSLSTVPIGAPAFNHTYGAPGQSTPVVPPTPVTTPPIAAPATCGQEACTKATTVPGTFTPPVPQQCVPLVLCVGPVAPQPLTPPVGVPPLCALAGPICLPPTTLVPSQSATVPGAGAVPLAPPVTVSVRSTGFAGALTPNAGEFTTIGPIATQVGPVPVTLCPATCPVPKAPGATMAGTVTITLVVGTQTFTQSVPVSA